MPVVNYEIKYLYLQSTTENYRKIILKIILNWRKIRSKLNIKFPKIGLKSDQKQSYPIC